MARHIRRMGSRGPCSWITRYLIATPWRSTLPMLHNPVPASGRHYHVDGGPVLPAWPGGSAGSAHVPRPAVAPLATDRGDRPQCPDSRTKRTASSLNASVDARRVLVLMLSSHFTMLPRTEVSVKSGEGQSYVGYSVVGAPPNRARSTRSPYHGSWRRDKTPPVTSVLVPTGG